MSQVLSSYNVAWPPTHSWCGGVIAGFMVCNLVMLYNEHMITLQSCEVIGSMEQVYTANSEAFHAQRMYIEL